MADAATPRPTADPTGRYVDAFEPARGSDTARAPGASIASRIERSPAIAHLAPEVQERVRELGRGASREVERNLSTLISSRGFGLLAPERQLAMLDVFAVHAQDRRAASGLARLADSAAFRDSDAAAQSAAMREAVLPARLRNDALWVLNTTEAQRISVNGVPIDVYGASADELETIRTTLSRLPASHLRTIPRVVVADTIGHGSRRTGGGWVPQRTIDAYEATDAGGRNAAAYRTEGWSNLPRLELTHESLSRRDVVRNHLSPTILHETGHAVDERYHLSRTMSADSLGGIDYNGGRYRGPEQLGPVHERFADGYMRYYLRTLDSDGVAYRTIDEAIRSVPE